MKKYLRFFLWGIVGAGLIHAAVPERSDHFPVSAPETSKKQNLSGMRMIIHELRRPEQGGEEIDGFLPKTEKEEKSLNDQASDLAPADRAEERREKRKILYLTFDDGPIDGTGNILDILEEEGIEATMFCVGRHAGKRPRLFRRERSMPNLLIANHTYSHANGHYSRFYSDTFGVMSDVEHAQLVLGGRKYLRLAGRNVWRLPELRRNDHALSSHRRGVEIPKYNTLETEGFYIYGWDIEWHFDHASGRPVGSAEALASRIRGIWRRGRTAQKGKVVLLAHDFMFRDRRSVSQLRRFIHIMKADGWEFQKISRYSRLRPEPMYFAKYYGKTRRRIASAASTTQPNLRKIPIQTSSAGRRPSTLEILSTKEIREGAETRKTTQKAQKTGTVMLSANIQKSDGNKNRSLSLQARINDAIREYDAERVDQLIRQGARINRVDEYGRIALNTAIRANSIFLVKKLIVYGADISLKDGSGATALQTARKYHRHEIEKFLIEYSLRHLGAEHLAAIIGKKERRRIDPLNALRD